MKPFVTLQIPEDETDKSIYFILLHLYLSSGQGIVESHLQTMERIDNYKN